MEYFKSLWAQVSGALSTELFVFGQSPITLSQVIAAPMLLIIGLLLVRIFERRLSRVMRNRNYDSNLIQLIRRGIYVVAIICLGLIALGMLNVPLGAFTFISGAIAIGVGFGAQAIINNFISGWILMGERPIRIGDLLEFEGFLGRVEAINTRSTRIRRIDGADIVTPNSALLENTVINWTLADSNIRTSVRVGIAYGSPVKLAADLMDQAAKEQKNIESDPPTMVVFEDFGDNALVLDVYFWTMLRPGGGDLRKLRSDIRFRIEELFNENNIVVAFPQRDVHMDGQLRLTRDDSPDPI